MSYFRDDLSERIDRQNRENMGLDNSADRSIFNKRLFDYTSGPRTRPMFLPDPVVVGTPFEALPYFLDAGKTVVDLFKKQRGGDVQVSGYNEYKNMINKRQFGGSMFVPAYVNPVFSNDFQFGGPTVFPSPFPIVDASAPFSFVDQDPLEDTTPLVTDEPFEMTMTNVMSTENPNLFPQPGDNPFPLVDTYNPYTLEPSLYSQETIADEEEEETEEDTRGPFAKLSDAAVNVARGMNKIALRRQARQAERDKRIATSADNLFMVSDPIGARGMFDVQTGLAQPDNLVPYLPMGQMGIETSPVDNTFTIANTLLTPENIEAAGRRESNEDARRRMVYEGRSENPSDFYDFVEEDAVIFKGENNDLMGAFGRDSEAFAQSEGFMNMFYNSPAYQQMLRESASTPEQARLIQDARDKRLRDVQGYYYEAAYDPLYYYPVQVASPKSDLDKDVLVFQGPDAREMITAPETVIKGLSRSSDDIGQLIPESDIKLMNQLSKEESVDKIDASNVRSDLNALRYQLIMDDTRIDALGNTSYQDNTGVMTGDYSGLSQAIKNLTGDGTLQKMGKDIYGRRIDSRPLRRLLNQFGEDGLKQLLQEVSQAEESANMNELPMGQVGMELEADEETIRELIAAGAQIKFN